MGDRDEDALAHIIKALALISNKDQIEMIQESISVRLQKSNPATPPVTHTMSISRATHENGDRTISSAPLNNLSNILADLRALKGSELVIDWVGIFSYVLMKYPHDAIDGRCARSLSYLWPEVLDVCLECCSKNQLSRFFLFESTFENRDFLYDFIRSYVAVYRADEVVFTDNSVIGDLSSYYLFFVGAMVRKEDMNILLLRCKGILGVTPVFLATSRFIETISLVLEAIAEGRIEESGVNMMKLLTEFFLLCGEATFQSLLESNISGIVYYLCTEIWDLHSVSSATWSLKQIRMIERLLSLDCSSREFKSKVLIIYAQIISSN